MLKEKNMKEKEIKKDLKKYELLHKRAVYLYHARKHRLQYLRYKKKKRYFKSKK